MRGRAAVAIALLAVLGACTPSPDGIVRHPRTSTADGAPSPAPAHLGDPRRAFAVWPEDTSTQARATLDGDVPPWRLDAEATARAFARRVLGWPHPRVERVSGAEFRVTDPDAGGGVELSMTQPAEPLWSVASVRGTGALAGYGPDIRIRGGRVELLGLEAEHGATTVDASARFGALIGRAAADDEGVATIDLGAVPSVAGHVLIVWRDGDGDVLSAFATAISAGDVAAG